MAMASKRERWTLRVAEFDRSGLSRRAWCASHGVNLSTLDYWRCRVGEVAGSGRARVRKRGEAVVQVARALTVVPLRVRAPVATNKPLAMVVADRSELVLEVADGVRLLLPQCTGAPWLALLLRELR